MTPYAFHTTGRNRTTLLVVLGVWAALIGAFVFLDAALWIVMLLAAFTMPAIYDLISGRAAGVTLDDSGLAWHAGRRSGDIAWPRISHLRLDTRLDLSVRASAVLVSGRKIALPLEATPPADQFEKVLSARGIKVERHHFSLLG